MEAQNLIISAGKSSKYTIELDCKVHCVQYGGVGRIGIDETENINWNKNAMSLILYAK